METKSAFYIRPKMKPYTVLKELKLKELTFKKIEPTVSDSHDKPKWIVSASNLSIGGQGSSLLEAFERFLESCERIEHIEEPDMNWFQRIFAR